tara:strand:+ start:963 stop:1169 length:207 start_codon:yes stop_codon:yes gene_type:complete
MKIIPVMALKIMGKVRPDSDGCIPNKKNIEVSKLINPNRLRSREDRPVFSRNILTGEIISLFVCSVKK